MLRCPRRLPMATAAIDMRNPDPSPLHNFLSPKAHMERHVVDRTPPTLWAPDPAVIKVEVASGELARGSLEDKSSRLLFLLLRRSDHAAQSALLPHVNLKPACGPHARRVAARHTAQVSIEDVIRGSGGC